MEGPSGTTEDDEEVRDEYAPFLDKKGKGKSPIIELVSLVDSNEPSSSSGAVWVNEEDRERLEQDAAFAAMLQESEYEKYHERQQRRLQQQKQATSSTSTELSTRAENTLTTPEGTSSSDQVKNSPQRYREVRLKKYTLENNLNEILFVGVILIPSCLSEAVMIISSLFLMKIIFQPIGQAYYIVFELANLIKCVLGAVIGYACIDIQKRHNRSPNNPRGEGLDTSTALTKIVINQMDIFIVIFITFMLFSATLDLICLVLSVIALTSRTIETQRRAGFSFVVSAACLLCLFIQCFALTNMVSILKLWLTKIVIKERKCGDNELPMLY